MKRFLLIPLLASLCAYTTPIALSAENAQAQSYPQEAETAQTYSSRFYTEVSGGYAYSGNDFDGYSISAIGGLYISKSKKDSIELEYIHVELDGSHKSLSGSMGVAALPGLAPLTTGTYNSSIQSAKIKENMVLCNYRHKITPTNSDAYSFDIGAGIGASFADRKVSGITTTSASAMGMTITSTETTNNSDSSTELVGQIFGALNVTLTKNLSLKLGLKTLFTRDFDLKVKRAVISNEPYQFIAEAGIHLSF